MSRGETGGRVGGYAQAGERKPGASVGGFPRERAIDRAITLKSTWNLAGRGVASGKTRAEATLPTPTPRGSSRGVASGKTRAEATLPTPNPRGSSLKAGGVSP
jgi:hypothetical protein